MARGSQVPAAPCGRHTPPYRDGRGPSHLLPISTRPNLVSVYPFVTHPKRNSPALMVFLDKPEPEGVERRSGIRRRWIVPPPPGQTGGAFEGVEILIELAALPLAVAAFQTYRDVLLWADTDVSDRGKLFPGGSMGARAASTPRLESVEEVITSLATLLRTKGNQARHVATACSWISRWAAREGFGQTELAFAHAAATVLPREPELAFEAGRAARRLGRYEYAVQWFRRAIGLARRTNNDEAKAAAYLGWGVLEELRGRRDVARMRFILAHRTARKAGLLKVMAAARHYLIALTVPNGTFDEGFAHANAALKLYGRLEDRLALLATDTGALLSEHQYFSAAVSLYEMAVPLMPRSAERAAAYANLARAAAALGQRQRYAEFWTAFEQEIKHGAAEYIPAALVELARGAWTLGYARQVSVMLNEAERIATERRDTRAHVLAGRLREAVRAGGPVDQDRPAPEEVERFIHKMKARLTELTTRR